LPRANALRARTAIWGPLKLNQPIVTRAVYWQQTIGFPPHDRIAFAAQLLELASIQDRYSSMAIPDGPTVLQPSGRRRNAFTPDPEEIRDLFVRGLEVARRYAIESQQQPATQLLAYRMMTIADRQHSRLSEQGVCVAQEQARYRATSTHFVM